MVETIILVINSAALAAILLKVHEKPPAIVGDAPDTRPDSILEAIGRVLTLLQAPRGTSATPEAVNGLWEVQKLVDDHWQHDGWVREGTPAYEKAWNSPSHQLRQGKTLHRGVC